MIYFIIGFAVLFLLISRAITKSTAPYLLSGHNMMSKEDQAKVNLDGLVVFWRKFHTTLAVLILVLGVGVFYYFDADWGIIISIIVALLGYAWAVPRSTEFYPPPPQWQKNVLIGVQGILLGLCLFITISFVLDARDSEIKWHYNAVEFTGYKGEKILFSDITETKILENPIEIKMKIYGMGTYKAKKGVFDIKSIGRATLLVTKNEPPYLYVRHGNNTKTIFNAPYLDVHQIHKELISKLEASR